MTVLDGNGQIFPAAIGIAETESTLTWAWFLGLVRAAFRVGDGEGIVALSDREKGIETSLADVLPLAAHGFCVYHISKNVAKRYKVDLEGLLWKAAKAATEDAFNSTIAEIKALHLGPGSTSTRSTRRSGRAHHSRCGDSAM